jgi:phosphomannomutase/phosphoglucomutase
VTTIFREYDIRGIVPQELNEQSVNSLGFYFAHEVREKFEAIDPCDLYVAVGYDARTHSPELFEYLSGGIKKAGVNILAMGMVPTGVNYFAGFQSWEIEGKMVTPHATVMITGSHNPPQYNGFKMTIDSYPFFGPQITALGDKIIAQTPKEIASSLGRVEHINAKERYIDRLCSDFSSLKGFSTPLALDCGNGVAGVVVGEILSRLEIASTILFEQPDGTFPNHHPDPSEEHNLEDLKHLIAKEGMTLGFAFDGDADRLAVLTDKVNIKGDQIAIIFARSMKKQGIVPRIIGEVKCSQAMYDEINTLGEAIMYKTGHSNLKVKLKETQAHLAAEVSGHLFFNDRWYGVDDAVYAMLRVIELVHQGVDLNAEVSSIHPFVSTDEIKVHVTEEKKFQIIDQIKHELSGKIEDFPDIIKVVDIDGVRVHFEKGWGLIRASNTTPVLVTRFEAVDLAMCEFYQEKMMQLLQKIMK